METDGDADICTHVLKLSEETCREPEHVVFEVLVVIVVVSIASLKVTVREVFSATEVSSSEGDVDETVGGVVSGSIPVVNPEDVVHWELKLLPELSLTPVVTRIL